MRDGDVTPFVNREGSITPFKIVIEDMMQMNETITIIYSVKAS